MTAAVCAPCISLLTGSWSYTSSGGMVVTTTTTNNAPKWKVGQLVKVDARTWVGINRPGGVGKITKVHEDGRVDVKYMVGSGSDQNLDAIHVHPYAELDRSCRRSRTRHNDEAKQVNEAKQVAEPKLVNEPKHTTEPKQVAESKHGTVATKKGRKAEKKPIIRKLVASAKKKLTSNKRKESTPSPPPPIEVMTIDFIRDDVSSIASENMTTSKVAAILQSPLERRRRLEDSTFVVSPRVEETPTKTSAQQECTKTLANKPSSKRLLFDSIRDREYTKATEFVNSVITPETKCKEKSDKELVVDKPDDSQLRAKFNNTLFGLLQNNNSMLREDAVLAAVNKACASHQFTEAEVNEYLGLLSDEKGSIDRSEGVIYSLI